MILADRVVDRSNFITVIRLGLAATVALWHGVAIAGSGVDEPSIRGLSPSYMAVNGFFILSGFLISHSVKKRDLAYYIAARVLRLYPALVALMICGTIFAIGLHVFGGVTPGAGGSWLYPLQSLAFLNASGTYPGMFSGNPEQEFDIPLWTLRYEALAYLALPVAGALALFATPIRAWVLWVFAVLVYGAILLIPEVPDIVREAARLAAAFALGVAIYGSRKHLRMDRKYLWLAIGVALALYPTTLFEAGANLVLAWTLFALGFAPSRRMVSLTQIPDWSYGLYIWHWPVFQTMKMALPAADAGVLLTFGMAATLIIADLSWRYIERPALAAKGPVATTLRALPVRRFVALQRRAAHS